MNKKPRCHNCKFSGPQFKIGKLTHLHCLSPVMETYFKEHESPSFWHSLRVFNDSCNDHEFKQIDLKNTDQLKNETSTVEKPILPAVLICECSSREHQIIIQQDTDDNLIYCHIHLVKDGFWRRLKAGLKYIFGYKCKYGQWEEFILKPEHANQLRELSELLSKHSK